jgi:hypothetical protein
MDEEQQILIDFFKFSESPHTHNEWFNKFFSLSLKSGDYNTFTYWMFKSLVMDKYLTHIPKEYELDLFLNLYQHIPIENTYSRLLRTMIDREPNDHKLQRIKQVETDLADYIDSDGYVQAYRGVFETPNTIDKLIIQGSFELKKALSFTLDKDIAYWFATRKQPETAKVISIRAPIERVLLYTNERSEKEIMVLPSIIKGKKYLDIIEEIVVFDKGKINKIDAMMKTKN